MPEHEMNFEPFKIKMVEPIRVTTRAQRKSFLKKADYNIFFVKAADIMVDLLTDSGTGAMTDRQWGALMMGDESYAGSRSFYRLKDTVNRLFGFPYVLPTHQGRAGEHILMKVLAKPGDLIPGNHHFDTTGAHIDLRGAEGINLVVEEAWDLDDLSPFKGNIDLDKLEKVLKKEKKRIPFVLMTLTCNSVGGQPVSMDNLKATKELCDKYKKPLYIDGARFAENAYFIKTRDKKYADWPVEKIVKKQMSFFDGGTFSLKKDGTVNIGGMLTFRNEEHYQYACALGTLFEGFPTYGGLAGRDMEALAQGLEDVLSEDYLAYRTGQVRRFGEMMMERGIPILKPIGGHAVYVNAGPILSHIPPDNLPGVAFANELYIEGGVRAVEIGTCMAGRDPKTGENRECRLELVRYAGPRRVYTLSHLEWAADCSAEVVKRAKKIQGLNFTYEPPALRHFMSRYKMVP